MHIRGGWRLFTEFKIGLIGTQGPKNIQAFIHRDITNNSKKILLWENQIADGGRYIFSSIRDVNGQNELIHNNPINRTQQIV
ncbi:MAG: hypothetical protein IPN46_16300 [Saprospiraceae bacterium]|nr:hypothetical protein [Saprospiraceae bacterium]